MLELLCIVTYSHTHSWFTHWVIKDITQRGMHYKIIAYRCRLMTKTVYTCEIVITWFYLVQVWFTDYNSSLHYSRSFNILICNSLKAIQGTARWCIFINNNEHPTFTLYICPWVCISVEFRSLPQCPSCHWWHPAWFSLQNIRDTVHAWPWR